MSAELRHTKQPDNIQSPPKGESLNPAVKDTGIQGLRDTSSTEEFIIRGHHLGPLGKVVKGFWSPNEGARAIKEASVEDHGTDYTGTNPQDADRFEEGVLEGLEDFMALPDDAPVKIVANKPDWICKACVIGDHCSEKPDDPLASQKDAAYIEAFRRSARERGIDGELTLEDETVVYSNAPAEVKKSLITDAGTVRRVWDVDTENMERPFPEWVRYVEKELKDRLK